ncbi:MAG TPA: glycoside hydrolase family 28 protein, partial [Paludibacter sp.]|nr:glycoside hydrolase family 28 protein [Paludibacter sp.]
VVENIYIENINMSDIPADPLLFDLFYGGKGPMEEEETEAQTGTVATPAVTIETPAFRNIFIKNIVSVNSNRAMYFNGLPEMKVKNVRVDNSVFKSIQGAVIKQTSGFVMNNVKISNTVGEIVEIENVDKATFSNVTNQKGEKVQFSKDKQNTDIVIE